MVRPTTCCDHNNNNNSSKININVKRAASSSSSCSWKAKELQLGGGCCAVAPATFTPAVPKKSAGSRRSSTTVGKNSSSRLKWNDPKNKQGQLSNFTEQEEELIIRLHSAIGSRWAIIAQQLPGRSDADVKNHWNTKLKKKLMEMGIDPVTHKPFSQIAIDYRNIGTPPIIHSIYDDYYSYSNSSSNSNSNHNHHHYQSNSSSNNNNNNSFASLIFSSAVAAAAGKSSSPSSDHHHRHRHPFIDLSTEGNNNNKIHPSLQNNNPNINSSSSFDLLSELQSIALVTEAPPSSINTIHGHTTTTSCHHGDNDNDNDRFLFQPQNSSINNSVLFPVSQQRQQIISSPTTSSNSSSTSTAVAAAASEPPFSWRDFLLDDEIPQMGSDTAVVPKLAGKEIADQSVEYEEHANCQVGRGELDHEKGGSSLDLETSFVDQLLGKEKEMLLLDGFMGLLEQEESLC